MAPERIKAQIREMASKGVGSFIICARQGLSIPYLSKLWFDRVRFAVETAKYLGLQVWLYDEQPYPSGISGGRVVLDHPEFEAKELEPTIHVVEGGKDWSCDLPWGELVCALAYPVYGQNMDWSQPVDLSENIGQLFRQEVFHRTGLTAYNRKRFLACDSYYRLDWTVPKGTWKVFVFQQVPVRKHKYFDRFVDPLNSDAIAYFIETTHERYAKELGSEFGKTVQGIFTDEIHPTGFEANRIPWSPLLPQLFQKRCGYRLCERLPELICSKGPGSAAYRYDVMNTVVESFIESYDRQVASWCKQKGIRYIGEKPILRSKQLSHFDIPGIDAGHQKAGGRPDILPSRYRANAKILASAAHFYKKDRALCECFHSIGWGMDLQDMKWMYDWLAIQGVDLFVNHAYYYTTDALTKHDAPPSSFVQMPWWAAQGKLSEYADALMALKVGKQRVVRVLMLDPITSSWTFDAGQSEAKEQFLQSFADLQTALFLAHIDFWVVDPTLLADATIVDRGLVLGGEHFDAMVLPALRNIEKVALSVLTNLAKAGGAIYSYRELPSESIDGQTPTQLKAFARAFRENPRAVCAPSVQALVQGLERDGLRDWSVQTDGVENPALHGVLLKHGKTLSCFVQNIGPKRQQAQIRAGFTGHELYPDGQQAPVAFAPFESRHFLLQPAAKPDSSIKPTCLSLPRTGWMVQALHDNSLRLDLWYLQTDDDIRPQLVHASPLVDQLSEGQFLVRLEREDHFGTPKTLSFPVSCCRYTTSFEATEGMDLQVRIEVNGIRGDWQLRVNDTELPASLFYEVAEIGAHYLEAPLTAHAGTNSIVIEVQNAGSGGGLLNPVYIQGAFLVHKVNGDWCVSPRLPPQGQSASQTPEGSLVLGQTVEAGLPFYSGVLNYTQTVELPEQGGGGQSLCIDDSDFRSSCELVLDGTSLGTLSWHPFVWPVTVPIKPGLHELVVRVLTTRLGYFEGQVYNPGFDCYQDVCVPSQQQRYPGSSS